MTSTRFRSATLATLAIAALVLAYLAFAPHPADAGEHCVSTKGELCITLNPDPATNPVNTDHTVILTFTVNGEPAEGSFDAGFFILSGPNAGESLTVAGDSSGEATFTYAGDGGAGTDEIVAFVCNTDECDILINCLEESPECITDITEDCIQDLQGPAGNERVAASVIFCLGPVEATKTWEDPTPTPAPSGTPVLAPATQAPTPAQLPQSGGEPGGSDTPWLLGLGLIAAAAIATSGGAVAFARRRVTR
jgi:hypothetical protein